jgi:hypothetical protein
MKNQALRLGKELLARLFFGRSNNPHNLQFFYKLKRPRAWENFSGPLAFLIPDNNLICNIFGIFGRKCRQGLQEEGCQLFIHIHK